MMYQGLSTLEGNETLNSRSLALELLPSQAPTHDAHSYNVRGAVGHPTAPDHPPSGPQTVPSPEVNPHPLLSSA